MNPNSVIADINAPVVKGVTAIAAAVSANTPAAENVAYAAARNIADPWWFWFIVSIPWGAIASFVAAVYTAALFAEWMWKKPIRWALVRGGVIHPAPKMTAREWAEKIVADDNPEEAP